MEKTTYTIWGLESGFNTENKHRDTWFHANPVFVVRHCKKDGHLKFVPLVQVYAETIDKNINATYWETTPAKEVKRSEDGSYRCYETENGTRYHLFRAGQLILGE